MSISRDEIEKIANLACIKLSEDEKELYQNEVSKILTWIHQLEKLNTDHVEPVYNIASHNQPLRPDTINQTNNSEQIFSNAPSEKYNYYVVPKVIE